MNSAAKIISSANCLEGANWEIYSDDDLDVECLFQEIDKKELGPVNENWYVDSNDEIDDFHTCKDVENKDVNLTNNSDTNLKNFNDWKFTTNCELKYCDIENNTIIPITELSPNKCLTEITDKHLLIKPENANIENNDTYLSDPVNKHSLEDVDNSFAEQLKNDSLINSPITLRYIDKSLKKSDQKNNSLLISNNVFQEGNISPHVSSPFFLWSPITQEQNQINDEFVVPVFHTPLSCFKTSTPLKITESLGIQPCKDMSWNSAMETPVTVKDTISSFVVKNKSFHSKSLVVPKNLFSVENQKIEEKNDKVDDPSSHVDMCLEDNSIIDMNTYRECNKMHFRSEYIDMTLIANPFLKERFIIKTSESTLNENVVNILQNFISSQKFIIENEGMKEMPLTTCKAGNSKICTEDNKTDNSTYNVNSDFCTNSMKHELCSFGNNETICKTLSFLFASQFSFPNTCKKNELCNNNESVVMPYINVHKKTQDSLIKISTDEEQHSVLNVDEVRTDESKNQLFNETSSLATDDKLFENMNISYCKNDSNYDIQNFSFISHDNSYTKLEIKEINQSNKDIPMPKLNFSDIEMIKEDYSSNLPQENIDCHNVNCEVITGRNLDILPQKSASFCSANGKPIIINKNSLQQAKEMWEKVTNDSWKCILNQHNPNINHHENNYAELLANTFQNTNENVSKLNSINAQKFCRDPVNNNPNLIELNTTENYNQSKHINSQTDQKELIELPSTDIAECKLNIDSDKNLSTESTYNKNCDVDKETESQVYHSPDFPLTQVMEVAEITYACLQEMEKGCSHTFSQFSPNPTKINNDFQNVNEVNLFQCGENILEENSMKHMDSNVKYFNRSIIQKSNLDTLEDKINIDPLIISRKNNVKILSNHASEKQIKCRTELFKINNNINCLFSNMEGVKKTN
ncbi:putative uncharacterized protein DDB_G0282133 [Centruroides vittatus]|uniref:putative uncharacterized protein DDB_G0282133 n=1 Tax=Centruroides vittatus TaxID=120091 RepID=UPI00350EBA5A